MLPLAILWPLWQRGFAAASILAHRAAQRGRSAGRTVASLVLLSLNEDIFLWNADLRPGDLPKPLAEGEALRGLLRNLLPWQMPAMGCLLQMLAAWGMFRYCVQPSRLHP